MKEKKAQFVATAISVKTESGDEYLFCENKLLGT